jgi:putative toxin-antitoxin system antitoxin component (TIGR02293 family)
MFIQMGLNITPNGAHMKSEVMGRGDVRRDTATGKFRAKPLAKAKSAKAKSEAFKAIITVDLDMSNNQNHRLKSSPLFKQGFIKSYADLKDPLIKINVVKEGIPASVVKMTAKRLHLTQEVIGGVIEISKTTLERKVSKNEMLSKSQSDLLWGLNALVDQVNAAIDDAGDGAEDFDAGDWVKAWLEKPLAALGNRRGIDLMDTAGGQEMVSRVLAQNLAGSFV